MRNGISWREMLASVRKVLTIVDAFTFETPEWSLGDLSAKLQMPKPTLHHMMTTLAQGGWVAQDPRTKRYRLAMRWWEKGWVAVHQLRLREGARPHLEALAKETQETVHLAVLDDTDPRYVVYVDKIESDHAVRAYSTVGGRAPSYCVATGKAILANDAGVAKPLLRGTLRRWTPATLVDGARLARDLELTRTRGYSMNLGEYRLDVHGAAAPIRNHEGEVFAAVGISAPAYRLPRKTIDRLAGAVIRAAREISASMGFLARPAPPTGRRSSAARP
jgi:IclR family KDG regulon transcriptional repressor